MSHRHGARDQPESNNPARKNKMRIVVQFGSYNRRRYSNPWIAKVTAWPIGQKAVLGWGTYLGNDSGGECEIEANPGDVVRWGQKDGRGNGTMAEWGIVQADGSIATSTESACKKHFLSQTAA
jgi:hypothetical protein